MATYYGHQEDASGNLLLPTPHSFVSMDSVELGSTASNAYTVGSYIVYNNRLCRVVKNIAKGNTLSSLDGGNLDVTTVGARLGIFGEMFQTKAYQYTFSLAPNEMKYITKANFGLDEPSGYTYIGLARYQLDSRYPNIFFLNPVSTTNNVMGVQNPTSYSLDVTATIGLVYVRTNVV